MIGVRRVTKAGSATGWQPFDGKSINLDDLREVAALLRPGSDVEATPVLTSADRTLMLSELAAKAGPRDRYVMTIVNGRLASPNGGCEILPSDDGTVVVLRLSDLRFAPDEVRERATVDDGVDTTYVSCMQGQERGGRELAAAVEDLFGRLAVTRRSWWWAPWAASGVLWLAVLVSLVAGTVSGAVPLVLLPFGLAVLAVAAWGLYRFCVWAQERLLLRVKGTELRLATHQEERKAKEVDGQARKNQFYGFISGAALASVGWAASLLG